MFTLPLCENLHMKLSTIHCITNNNYSDCGLQFTFKRNTYSREGVPVEFIHVSGRINSCVLNNPRLLVSKEWARSWDRLRECQKLHFHFQVLPFYIRRAEALKLYGLALKASMKQNGDGNPRATDEKNIEV